MANGVLSFLDSAASLSGVIDPGISKLLSQASAVGDLGVKAGVLGGGAPSDPTSIGLAAARVAAALFQDEGISKAVTALDAGQQAVNLATGATSLNPGSAVSLASTLAGLLGADKGTQQVLSLGGLVASAGSVFSGAAAGLAGALGPVGWVAGAASLVASLFSSKGEQWTGWQTIGTGNLNGGGAVDPSTGRLPDTGSEHWRGADTGRFNHEIMATAATDPIKNVQVVSLRPQQVLQRDQNAANHLVSTASVSNTGAMVRPNINALGGMPPAGPADASGATRGASKGLTPDDTSLAGANYIVAVIDGVRRDLVAADPSVSRGAVAPPTGERIWVPAPAGRGSQSFMGLALGGPAQRGSFTESELRQKLSVPTGKSVLDLNVGFKAPTPAFSENSKQQTFVISPEEAAKLRGLLGGADTGNVNGTDPNSEAFRYLIAQMGEVRHVTDESKPGSADITRFVKLTPGEQDAPAQWTLPNHLKDPNSQTVEVTLNEKWTPATAAADPSSQTLPFEPKLTFTAPNADDAVQTAARSTMLLQYLASHQNDDGLGDFARSQPQKNAPFNLTAVYQHVRDRGLLPKLDRLTELATTPLQGKTSQEQFTEMAARGNEMSQLKKDLGLAVDVRTLLKSPDVAAATHGDPVLALKHYIEHGNAEGRVVNEAAKVLPKWQPAATGWNTIQARMYIASNPDIIKAGLNEQQARDHFNGVGRTEGRNPGGFNLEAYLASRPDVRSAAVAAMSKPAVMNPGGINVRGIGNSPPFVASPATAPSEDQIKEFALQRYIDEQRAALTALPPAPAPKPLARSPLFA